MSKEECLELIKLLSALESWSFSERHQLPDYLLDKLCDQIAVLEREVLK